MRVGASSSDDQLSPRAADLLRATYRVAATTGSHRMSLQDVADEAGVSKGLVLYHFTSKAMLLSATMRWALERTAERIRAELAAAGLRVGADTAPPGASRSSAAPEQPGGSGGQGLIEALLQGIWVSPEANRRFYLLYLDLVEHAAREEAFADLPGMSDRIIDGLYADLVRTGMDRGDLRVQDPAVAARTMRALIEGLFLLWLQEPDWAGTHAVYRQRCADGLTRLLTDVT